MLELVLATRNKGKIREIKEILNDLNLRILTYCDFPSFPEIKENGTSFRENAISKARTVAQFTGKISLADDSGIEVDALNGKPGIFSARFAGEGCSDSENNEKLLKLMKDVPLKLRGATFRCVIAIATPEDKIRVTEGTWRGIIGFKQEGSNGFGYDSVFIVPKYQKTSAQLLPEEKNRISHRAKALRQAKQILEKMIKNV